MSLPKKVLTVLGIVLVALQFIPVDRASPASGATVVAPPEVIAILERSCYDCHSNEPEWPWYGYVAPFSLLIEHDIEEAREHVNFSTWDQYDAGQRAHKISECWEMVEEGEMPLWFYTPLHRDAVLSDADKGVIRAWAASEGERASANDHD